MWNSRKLEIFLLISFGSREFFCLFWKREGFIYVVSGTGTRSWACGMFESAREVGCRLTFAMCCPIRSVIGISPKLATSIRKILLSVTSATPAPERHRWYSLRLGGFDEYQALVCSCDRHPCLRSRLAYRLIKDVNFRG